MTFADIIEKKLAALIIKKLEERSNGTKRAWLNKELYDEAFEDRNDAIAEFDSIIEIDNLKSTQFLCVEFTHTLIHFDDDKMDEVIDKFCEKVEDYYIKIITEIRNGIPKEYNMRYREEPIKVRMDYRFFEVTYRLGFYNW
jgi:hypothetical protein